MGSFERKYIELVCNNCNNTFFLRRKNYKNLKGPRVFCKRNCLSNHAAESNKLKRKLKNRLNKPMERVKKTYTIDEWHKHIRELWS